MTARKQQLLTVLLVLTSLLISYAWETRPSGELPSFFMYRNGSYVKSLSALDAPKKWVPRFMNCERDSLTKRCVGAHKFKNKSSKRNLQSEEREVYIEVLFGDTAGGPGSKRAQDIFDRAASFWNNVIAANSLMPLGVFVPNAGSDTEDISLNFGVTCGIRASEETFTVESVDLTVPSTLRILAQVQPIDNLGGVLASAGPCLVADDTVGNPQTYVGIMTFDEADFNAQLQNDFQALENTVKHEMGHVLGIGTFWNPGLVDNPVSENINNIPTFNGENALSGNRDMGFGETILVENNGGQGTADAHWEESVYTNELMTGFLNAGNNPLSILSVRSLLDIGLTVNECAAQGFGTFVGDERECEGFINPNSPEDPDNTVGPPPSKTELNGLSTGAIIGIVAACIGAVCAIPLVVLFFFNKDHTPGLEIPEKDAKVPDTKDTSSTPELLTGKQLQYV